jgi:hypothetical protein
MLHGLKIMTLVQAVAQPFEKESIHSPLLIDQVGDVHRPMCTRGKLLHFDDARIVIHLEV